MGGGRGEGPGGRLGRREGGAIRVPSQALAISFEASALLPRVSDGSWELHRGAAPPRFQIPCDLSWFQAACRRSGPLCCSQQATSACTLAQAREQPIPAHLIRPLLFLLP